MENDKAIGALEELLSQIKLENKKFQFSSELERLKKRVQQLEDEVKELKNGK
jgi:cell division protein FtsB